MGWGGPAQASPFPSGPPWPRARPPPRTGRFPGLPGAAQAPRAPAGGSPRPFFPGPLLPSVSAAAVARWAGGPAGVGGAGPPARPFPSRARPGRPTETAAGGSRIRNWPGSPGPGVVPLRRPRQPRSSCPRGNSCPEARGVLGGCRRGRAVGWWGRAQPGVRGRGTPDRVGPGGGAGVPAGLRPWLPEAPPPPPPMPPSPSSPSPWEGRWVEGPGEGGDPWRQALARDTGSNEGRSQAKLPFCTYGCISAGEHPTSCVSAAPLPPAAPSPSAPPLHLQRLPYPVVGPLLSLSPGRHYGLLFRAVQPPRPWGSTADAGG